MAAMVRSRTEARCRAWNAPAMRFVVQADIHSDRGGTAPASSSLAMKENTARMASIVSRVAAGSEQALGELFDLTVDRIFPLALRLSRDRVAAEETVCAVYAQAWRSADRFPEFEDSVTGWLLGICADVAVG